MTAKQFTFTAGSGEDMTAQITRFAKFIGLERAAQTVTACFLWLAFLAGGNQAI